MNFQNRNKYKRLTALILAIVMLCAFAVCGFAAPDLTRKGSINLEMKSGGQVIPGGTVALYRVGKIVPTGDSIGYEWEDAFKNCNTSLTNIESESLALYIADYIKIEKIQGTTCNIGNDGKAYFGDLDAGLYLVVQTEAAEGYMPINPFLISVPYNEDGTYHYDVDASPKFEPVPETTTETTETTKPTETTDTTETTESTTDTTETTNPTNPTQPTTGSDTTSTTKTESTTVPTLPVTGQLNWPIPMLAFGGLFLVVVGLILISSKRKVDDEG